MPVSRPTLMSIAGASAGNGRGYNATNRQGDLMVTGTQVPDGWTKTTLRDQLVVCRNGLVCRQDADPMKATPVTRIETIADGKINWDRVGYVTVEDANPEYLLRRGDILMSHINSVKHIGKVARKTDDRPMLHGMNLMALRCAEGLDHGFGFVVMASHQTKAYMERRAKKAVNQASINRQDIFSLPILLPPLPEQRAIAAVLDSIDEAIERTEAVITATERLRESLLHELLSRGVPGWHSAWKEVRGIGTIPADWDVVRLGDVAAIASGQCDPRDPRFQKFLFVAPDDIESATGRLIGRRTVADARAISGKYKFDQNDVLYCKIRPYLMKVYAPHQPGLCSADIYPLRPRSVIDRTFLALALLSRKFTDYTRTCSDRTGIPKINRTDLLKYRLALPSLTEQRTIAAVLEVVGQTIERVEKEKDTLDRLKGSVADALLTGRLRVSACQE